MRNRLFGLDILRTLAILFVMFGHSLWVLYSSVTPNTLLDTLFIFSASVSGYIGVEIFFVLSGFLIGSIFIKEIVNKESSSITNISLFWVKRWFRTIPNYYLYIIIYLAFYYLNSWEGISDFSWKYILFVQNFYAPGPGFIGVAWSLSVEEWFYLLLPIIYFVSFYISKNNKVAFKVTIFLLFFVPFFSRILFTIMEPNFHQYSKFFGCTTLFRLDSIAYGVGLSWLWNIEEFKHKFLRNKNRLFTFGLISLTSFLVYLLLFVYKTDQKYIYVLISYPWATFSILLFFPLMISFQLKDDNNNYIVKFIILTSKISYSLYLSHPLFIKAAEHIMHSQHLENNFFINLLFFILIFLFSYLTSFVTYKYCEELFLKFREKVIKKISVQS